MSEKFITISADAIIANQFGLSQSDTWTSQSGGFIGWEAMTVREESRYRLYRYQFTLPIKEDNTGLDITGFTNITITLPGKRWGYTPRGEYEPGKFYAWITENDKLTNEVLKHSSSMDDYQKRELTFSEVADNGTVSGDQPNVLSFDIKNKDLQGGKTYYLFLHPGTVIESQKGAVYGREWSDGLKPTLKFQIETYTACSAPTRATINGVANGIVRLTPSSPPKFTWSGAASGASNEIKGYRIYWRRGFKPTTNSQYWEIEGAETESYTVSSWEGGGIRGGIYYFSIQTIGKQAGFDSGLFNIGVAKINDLPFFPNAGMEVTVPSNFGQSITPPNAKDLNEDTLTYYYCKPGSTEKIGFASSFVPNKKGIYNIYAYDGYEYSEPYTINVIQNSKPVIEVSDEYTPTIKANGSTIATNGSYYVVEPKFTMTLTDVTKGTIYIQLQCRNNTISTTHIDVGSSNIYEYSNSAVQQALKSFYNNEDLSYSYNIWVNDGIENSEIKTKTYVIPGPPKQTGPTGDFYNTIQLKFYEDESLTNYEIIAFKTHTKENVISTKTQTLKDGVLLYDITFNKNCTSQTSITFQLTGSNSYLTKTTTFSAISGKMPNLNTEVSWSQAEFRPFTEEERSIVLSVPNLNSTHVFGEEEGLGGEIVISKGAASKSISVKLKKITEIDISLELNTNQIFTQSDFDKNTFGLKGTYGWAGLHFLDTKLTFKLNGVTYEIPSKQIVLNFNEAPEVTSLTPILSNPIKDTTLKVFKLQEGMQLKFQVETELYTQEEVEVVISYSLDGSNYTQFVSKSFSNLENYGSGPKTLNKETIGKNTLTFEPIEFNRVITNSMVYWKAEILGSITKEGTECKEEQETIPHTKMFGFFISSGTAQTNIEEQKYQIKVRYNCSSGIDDDTIISAANLIINGDKTVSNDNSANPLIFTRSCATDSDKLPTTFSAVLEITTIKEQKNGNVVFFKTTKTSTTPAKAIFFNAPTIAYRPHCVGINTINPENTASMTQTGNKPVLVISPTKDRTGIIINSANDQFFIESNGQTIIYGFKIDGGTWD